MKVFCDYRPSMWAAKSCAVSAIETRQQVLDFILNSRLPQQRLFV
jgi:hypothetical protein